jgi:MerR family transcriptional regulator/heat shock protein HspR
MKRKKGYFSISAVAQMFSVHQQTIRLYEREGFICPKRSEGNTRLFSEEDINQLEEVINLTHHLGINLAGVEMILKQQKKIEKLQKEINTLFKSINTELEEEREINKKFVAGATQRLAHLRDRSADRSTDRATDRTIDQANDTRKKTKQSPLESIENRYNRKGDSNEQ